MSEQNKPVAWIRFLKDGLYEGPVMNCDRAGMENVRYKISEWTPLYASPGKADAEQKG